MAWPNKSATALRENTPPGYFLIPQGTADREGKYELRTAGACRPALSLMLGLRCECELYGTTANQVQVLYNLGAQCGSMTCFCGADLRAWSCTSLLFRKNLSSPFLSDRILYHSHFSSFGSSRLPSRNSGIFGTKITQSKVKPLASESGNFFPRENCGFSKISLDKLPVT